MLASIPTDIKESIMQNTVGKYTESIKSNLRVLFLQLDSINTHYYYYYYYCINLYIYSLTTGLWGANCSFFFFTSLIYITLCFIICL